MTEYIYNDIIYRRGELLPLGLDTFFVNFFLGDGSLIYKQKLLNNITGLNLNELLEEGLYLSPRLKNKDGFEKTKMSDVVIKHNNMVLNLEMNSFYYDGFEEKNLTYLAKLFSEIKTRGKGYKERTTAIQVNFDMFDYSKTNDLKDTFRLVSIVNKKVYSVNFLVIHINLKLVSKKIKSKEQLSELEELLVPFINSKEEVLNSLNKTKEIKEVLDAMKYLSAGEPFLTDAEIEKFDEMEKNMIMNYGFSKGEKFGYSTGYSKGEKSGYSKGEKSGYSKGEKFGYSKGVIETVCNMLKENIDINVIERITGINRKEIEKYQSSISKS